MTARRRIKMPDGRFIRPSEDPLAQFLAQQQAYVNVHAPPPPASASVPAPGGGQSQAAQRDYSTDSFDIRLLAQREVTVLGAGSVGSHLVAALGPAGLTIHAIDAGTVQSRHTQGGRTAYDPTQVGSKKVHALKQKVERDFPGTTIKALPYHTAEIPDPELTSMFRRSLVVFLAIDDPEQILRIGDLAYPITELIQAAIHAQGASGHIAICAPAVTPCLRCTLGINTAMDIHRLDSEPAAGMDIVAVVQQAARIALDIAYSKVSGRPITRWDTARNLIYVANAKQQISPEGPGLHFESSRKRPGCPVCNHHIAA